MARDAEPTFDQGYEMGVLDHSLAICRAMLVAVPFVGRYFDSANAERIEQIAAEHGYVVDIVHLSEMPGIVEVTVSEDPDE
jgi:hypothetical protein